MIWLNSFVFRFWKEFLFWVLQKYAQFYLIEANKKEMWTQSIYFFYQLYYFISSMDSCFIHYSKTVLNSNYFLLTVCFSCYINNWIKIMILSSFDVSFFYHKIDIIILLSCNWIVFFVLLHNVCWLFSFHPWIQLDLWWVKTSFLKKAIKNLANLSFDIKS